MASTPGSHFQWWLNSGPPRNLGSGDVSQDYFVIAGVDDLVLPPNREIQGQEDGVVSVSSASLLDKNIPLALVDRNHVDMKTNEHSASLIEDFLTDSYQPPDLLSNSLVFCVYTDYDVSQCSGSPGFDSQAGILELRIPDADSDTRHYKIEFVGDNVLDFKKNADVDISDDECMMLRIPRPGGDEFFSRIHRNRAAFPEIGFWADEGSYAVRIKHRKTVWGVPIPGLWDHVSTADSPVVVTHLGTTMQELDLVDAGSLAIKCPQWFLAVSNWGQSSIAGIIDH